MISVVNLGCVSLLQIYGAEKLHRALLNRPKNKPLITVWRSFASELLLLCAVTAVLTVLSSYTYLCCTISFKFFGLILFLCSFFTTYRWAIMLPLSMIHLLLLHSFLRVLCWMLKTWGGQCVQLIGVSLTQWHQHSLSLSRFCHFLGVKAFIRRYFSEFFFSSCRNMKCDLSLPLSLSLVGKTSMLGVVEVFDN